MGHQMTSSLEVNPMISLEHGHNVTNDNHNISTWIVIAQDIAQTLDDSILHRFATNLRVDRPAFYSLIFAYSCLIFVGSAGNFLVVFAVTRKPAMRTARNMFMINLAVSDLLLCLITSPLTLMEIITQYWPLGRQDVICKMLGILQAVSIFVSSFSISAIALDRYQVIVFPTRDSLQKFGAFVICVLIWMTAIVLAAPMFFWRTLKHHDVHLPSLSRNITIAYCIEEWPMDHGRAYYSLFCLLIQFVLPIVTVSIAYLRICRKLRDRYISKQSRKSKDDQRMRRTNSLLVSIAIIFFASWLPLNVFNLVTDLMHAENTHGLIIVYAVCHMLGMSSACSNPLLYGWLNDNFRKEFKEILATFCPCVKMEVVRERVGSIRSSLSKKKMMKSAQSNGNDGVPSSGKDESCPLANGIEVNCATVNIYHGTVETVTTTDNGLGMTHGDTEMTELTRV